MREKKHTKERTQASPKEVKGKESYNTLNLGMWVTPEVSKIKRESCIPRIWVWVCMADSPNGLYWLPFIE